MCINESNSVIQSCVGITIRKFQESPEEYDIFALHFSVKVPQTQAFVVLRLSTLGVCWSISFTVSYQVYLKTIPSEKGSRLSTNSNSASPPRVIICRETNSSMLHTPHIQSLERSCFGFIPLKKLFQY